MSLLIANSQVLELQKLKNSVTDEYDNGATVTATMYDPSGAEVGGQTWPIALQYVADSDGLYRYTLPPDLVLTEDEEYTVVAEAIGSGAQIGRWACSYIAELRGCC